MPSRSQPSLKYFPDQLDTLTVMTPIGLTFVLEENWGFGDDLHKRRRPGFDKYLRTVVVSALSQPTACHLVLLGAASLHKVDYDLGQKNPYDLEKSFIMK